MKKLFFVFILLLFAQGANAQLFSKEKLLNSENNDMRTLSWGYFLGFNKFLLAEISPCYCALGIYD